VLDRHGLSGAHNNFVLTGLSTGPTYEAGNLRSQVRIGVRYPLLADGDTDTPLYRHRGDTPRSAGYLSLDSQLRFSNQTNMAFSLFYDDYRIGASQDWLSGRLDFQNSPASSESRDRFGDGPQLLIPCTPSSKPPTASACARLRSTPSSTRPPPLLLPAQPAILRAPDDPAGKGRVRRSLSPLSYEPLSTLTSLGGWDRMSLSHGQLRRLACEASCDAAQKSTRSSCNARLLFWYRWLLFE
jgi:hypothetical protein